MQAIAFFEEKTWLINLGVFACKPALFQKQVENQWLNFKIFFKIRNKKMDTPVKEGC